MWKVGVTAQGPMMKRALEVAGTRRFALTLLAGSEIAMRVMDEVLLARLYDELVVGGNIHKTTRRNRFKGLDKHLLTMVSEQFSAVPELCVHDVGASSGITSLELWQALIAQRPARVHASDYYTQLMITRMAHCPWAVVCDEDGAELQFVGAHFVLRAKQGESALRPVNRWLQRRARRFLPQVAEVLQAHRAGQPLPHAATLEFAQLWHPECSRTAAHDARFSLGRHDVFMPSPPVWHVVRVMNVLNPGYFSAERQRAAVQALVQSLLPGGVLIVGRTREEADASTAVSFFVREAGGLRVLLDLQGGAENRALILEAGVAACTASSSTKEQL